VGSAAYAEYILVFGVEMIGFVAFPVNHMENLVLVTSHVLSTGEPRRKHQAGLLHI
jgi:hypothetical protein